MNSMEFTADFRNRGEWSNWVAEAKPSSKNEIINGIVQAIEREGLIEPLTGLKAQPGSVRMSQSIREGLSWNGLNSRSRGVLSVFDDLLPKRNRRDVRIFGAEAVTTYALRMRGIFPRYYGTEFAAPPEEASRLFPITSEDLTGLSFKDSTFDFVTTNEVLEHVSDIDKALTEIVRVLRPGGWHIGTVPFYFNRDNGEVRARLIDGVVKHILPPVYHGNPIASDGSLVFEIPGWDIINRCCAAGFKDAFMRFLFSARQGIAAEGSAGVFVLCARK